MANGSARTDTLSRDQTRSLLLRHHWWLAGNHAFTGSYAAQVVHGYFCLHPKSSAPADVARRGRWNPGVPDVKTTARATGMAESNVRRCMQTLAAWGLIDVSDGYDKARLVSVDEESEYARQLADRAKRKTSRKRTVMVTADMIEQVEYHG